MNIFSKIKKQLFPDPEIGQVYTFVDDMSNPFPDRKDIRILSIRGEWVQYEFVGGNGNRFSKKINDLKRFWILRE